MQSGVYQIRNSINGKVYVGSTVNFRRRWIVHQCHLRRGSHPNKSLLAEWNECGPSAFEFSTVLICAPQHLVMYEDIVLKAKQAYGLGYNATPHAGTSKDRKCGPEELEQMRLRATGKKASEATRAKLRAAQVGKKMPASFSAFLSKRQKGKAVSAETREKIGALTRGTKVPLPIREVRAKKLTMAIANEVRALHASGMRQKAIAERYEIDQSMVSMIVSGKRWAPA